MKDIDLVIQWRVTCDPCMLWQRFGRGARDKELRATALLFVEPKDLDQVDPPKGRKRKAAEGDQKSKPKSKRVRKETPVPMRLDASAASEEEFWEARRAVYHEPIDDGNSKKAELNHVLGDVINADVRGIHCRRKPFKVYFDDDECSGLCVSSACSALNNAPQELTRATMLLMDPALVVRHIHLVSVAIPVTRKSSKICFKSLTATPITDKGLYSGRLRGDSTTSRRRPFRTARARARPQKQKTPPAMPPLFRPH